MHCKLRRDPLLGREQPSQLAVDFADQAVRARSIDAIAIWIICFGTDEMITLFDGEDKKRVAFVDAMSGESIEKLAESLIVVFELLNIVRFTRTAGRMDFSGFAVLIVSIRDVSKGDRNPSLLHLRDVGESCAGEEPIESRKSRLVERVRNRVPV